MRGVSTSRLPRSHIPLEEYHSHASGPRESIRLHSTRARWKLGTAVQPLFGIRHHDTCSSEARKGKNTDNDNNNDTRKLDYRSSANAQGRDTTRGRYIGVIKEPFKIRITLGDSKVRAPPQIALVIANCANVPPAWPDWGNRATLLVPATAVAQAQQA